jgi:hypothetical protein
VAAAQPPSAGPPAPGDPVLTPSVVPAAGASEALLAVSAFGRYSVRARSSQGTALSLVDRMAGELGAAGVAGREDGRVDVFLDRGAYKLRLTGDPRSSGEARLEAAAFRELHAAPQPRLVEHKLVSAALADLEQRSYWLSLAAPRLVFIEAAGRGLADLRLWRDGGWLEDAQPDCVPVEPEPGRPLLRCRLAGWLEPGLYRLTAYGGVPQEWAAGGDERPLHLRWGIPELPEAGRRRLRLSPRRPPTSTAPSSARRGRCGSPPAGSTAPRRSRRAPSAAPRCARTRCRRSRK